MKPFYRKKRYGAIIVTLLLVYFCLIPSPLRVSPETTGITTPLLPDGTPDYFAAWSNETWLPNLSPPQDNGARMMIAACGPRILEQIYLMNSVPWEELPTNEKSKEYFETSWKPMCEAMGIDPLERPRFLDKKCLTVWVYQKAKELEGKPEAADWDFDVFDERYKKTAWKTAEHPEVAAWVADYSPVLDLMSVAVRKKHYEGWRQRADSLVMILLPDVQASREFARSFQVRIASRIGDGDIDGAIDDLMSMHRLARHFFYSDLIVTKLVGSSIEGITHESAVLLLQSGKATREQLVRFADELQKLPSRWDDAVIDIKVEYLMQYDTLLAIHKRNIKERFRFGKDNFLDTKIPFYFALPFDMNIAGKRLTELMQDDQSPEWRTSPAKWNQFAHKNAAKWEQSREQREKFQVRSLAIPLIRVRSRIAAEWVYDTLSPALQAYIKALLNSGTKTELFRLALQLELYKTDNKKYPDTLGELVPKYIEEIPLDPFTGRHTLQYKPEQEGYVLYSFGQNGKDDNGEEPTKEDRNAGDVVLKR